MSEAPLEPLDPDLAALFAREREQGELPAPDPEVVDRAIERAKERAESLGSSSSEPRPPSGQVPPSAPTAAQFGVKALALSGLVGALLGGAVTYAWVAPSATTSSPVTSSSVANANANANASPSTAPSSETAPSMSASAAASVSAQVAAPPKPAPLSSASARPSASAAMPSPAVDLVRERELVDAARAALSKGHPDETLRLLREHETRFGAGQLVEEREALFVVAFARSGKKDIARVRLAAFRKAHPTSPMLSTLEREVGDLDASP